MRKLLLIIFMITLITPAIIAQPVEMADSMEAQGKINVVVAVAFLVLAILSAWLIRIEFRVRQMEKEQNNKA